MTTVAACRTCGTEPLENARFCHGCGSPVNNADSHAEYKQVTVLFADVVHSMDIAAAVGAERLREIMADLADRCAAVVERYGGTVDKFTGDGIMAVFGAPLALEDHAVRACLSALAIQEEAEVLAGDVKRHDDVDLRLRIGLNSGEVIAGQLGSGPFGYTAMGEQVGMAQRMESVAAPGGVMLSQSTARLVEHVAVVDEHELVRVKGSDAPVPAHRLRSVGVQPGRGDRQEASLVGRHGEMTALSEMLGSAIDGAGGVVGLVGPAGIGKSRLVRETAAIAGRRGMAVLSTFCQSHTRDIAFHAAGGLLRALFDIAGVSLDTARKRVRERLPHADRDDLVLLDDLLGIGEPDTGPIEIDPDARRRRLTRLVRSAALTRTTPTLYVIEDVHWLDDVSESMLDDLFSVLPRTHSLGLFTYRPEYRGLLLRTSKSQTIALAPLSFSDAALLTTELLGNDPSVAQLSAQVAERAAGNPFFAEEIVRDLVERHVLSGKPGAYICHADSANVSVPATVQATIAARIDRLGGAAKRTLNAAAVIGSRFDADLLACVDWDAALDELVDAELLDPVPVSRRAEYAFRHPLIRAVAYESQLKSDRSLLHQRVAGAIEQRDSSAVEENAALIAAHLEAAGDMRAAFGWHMRAATWLTNRDIGAARASWQRAREVADQLPDDDPDRTSMRIAPRALLCGHAWRAGGTNAADTCYDELRDLCAAAGDLMSFVMGTSGVFVAMTLNHRFHEARSLAPEYIRLLESTGEPALILLINTASHGVLEAGGITEALSLFQRAIDVADGDTTLGNFFFESPLGWAITLRGLARCLLGHAGWRDDLQTGLVMARQVQGITQAAVATYGYAVPLLNGALMPDAISLGHTADALRTAELSGDDVTLAWTRVSQGIVLARLHAGDPAAMDLLVKGRQQASRHRDLLAVTMADTQIAECKAHAGDLDAAIEIARATVAHLFDCGGVIFRGPASTVLVESLLRRGTAQDVREAQTVIDTLAACPVDTGFVLHELPLLRLRALLARAHGDDAGYRDYRDRYCAMATSLGFEGHKQWAEAMR